MASDDESSKEGHNLEISPMLSHLTLMDDRALTLNSFYDDGLDLTPFVRHSDVPLSSAQETNSRFQKCRRCRLRRRSESVVDDFRVAFFSQDQDVSSWVRSMPKVQKQHFKKTQPTVGGNRKLLREPILRALQSCFHPQSNARRKLLEKSNTDVGETGIDTATQLNETQLLSGGIGGGSRGITDFRDLINECHNLLEQEVDFTGRHSQINLTNRTTKNFTTMRHQSLNTKCKSWHKSSSEYDYDYYEGTGVLPLNSISSSTSLPGTQPNITALRSTNTATPSATSSCSQQAGNGAANATTSTNASGDDVTIDELASYFDTFVHIPKKMSSMAEMMYI